MVHTTFILTHSYNAERSHTHSHTSPLLVHTNYRTCINQSYHIWTSHFKYGWVMSHMNESYPIWTRHVTFIQCSHTHSPDIFSPAKKYVDTGRESSGTSRHMWMRHTYESTSHTNESHIWMSHTYEWVLSHMSASCELWGKHVTFEYFKNSDAGRGSSGESCHMWMHHTYEWITHIWMNYTYEWVLPHMSASCELCGSRVTYEYV